MKTNKLFVPFLLFTIVALAGLCFYQQRIIAQQSFEIRWLMANGRH
ncbi:MAG: hypothetical protein HY234_02020 [Acidobacteria bacterium]|nr:hypothetical protein [Acidobacteriota bacterium]MBI3661816.1 hypothetical protein [Acidobacteriota bacterium]